MPPPLRLKRFWIWQLLLAALAVGLCFVPLFNILGYEFSLAMAVAASLAGLHLGSVHLAHARRRDEGLLLALRGGHVALLSLSLRAVLANLSLLLLPLLIICLNALRVKNCDLLEGLLFFAMLPVLSMIIATVTGTLWGAATNHPWLATTGALLTLLGSVVWGVIRFHGAPAIFAYDPFVGFFPGAMYDETVSVGATFLLYRLHNLAWLAGALLLAAALFEPLDLRLRLLRRPRRLWPLFAAAPCLLAGLGLFLLRGDIGFAISAQKVAQELGGKRKTAHFTIHYPDNIEQDKVDLLASDHEFRYAQLKKYLGHAPPAITSFIFASTEQKRRLMGAGRTFIAKPWRQEVYLQDMGFPHPVLKHELAHVFAGQFGDPLFGVSLRWATSPLPHPRFNVGLIEGLAVAADWRPYGESTAHQYAAALKQLGLAPPLESLFGAGFLTHSAGRSYTLAGSFCRRLVQQFGVEKLVQVYRNGGDFLAVYGRTLKALLQEWSSWLTAEVKVPDTTLQLARERFRLPSILRRVCGHEVANLRAEAADLLGHNRDAEAIALLQRVCSFEPGDPGHHLRLVVAQVEARKLDQALAGARKLLKHPAMTKPLKRDVLELIGDLLWWGKAPARARELYVQASRLASGPGGRRMLNLKLWGLGQGGEVATLVQRYITPAPDDPRDPGRDVHLAQRLQGLLPTEGSAASGLGHYLVSKQLAGRDHCDLALAPAARAIGLGLPDQDFIVEAYLTLARCQHRQRKLEQAATALEELLQDTRSEGKGTLPGGTVLLIQDWQQRVRWESGGSGAF